MKRKMGDPVLAYWRTLTKFKTKAVSHLIVADIYGGFCRSVFTQFCPGWPLITRGELRKITGIITRRARHRTKICCFTAPQEMWHTITEVQITTGKREEFFSLRLVKNTQNIFNILKKTPMDLFSPSHPLGLFVTCELWVEKMAEKSF